MSDSELNISIQDYRRLWAAIGQIVVEFQHLEFWNSDVLSELLGLRYTHEPYLVMASMSFRQKVDLMTLLFEEKAKNEFGADIGLARKALYAAEEFRNRVVHSVWVVSEEDATWFREKGGLRGKKGFVKQRVCVNIDKLERASKSIRKIRDWHICPAHELEFEVAHLKSCEIET